MKPVTETRVVEATFVAGAVDPESMPPPTLVEAAFAGRSNVGKSSLLNAMMQRNGLARTSRTPGCTRQMNIFEVRCADGLNTRFVDLPGYGWAKRSHDERKKWQRMIEDYLRGRSSLRAVVLLVDVRRGVEEEERQLIDFMAQARVMREKNAPEVILVATKVDKLGAAGRKPALEALKNAAGVRALGFSAVTSEGREDLWARIRAAAL